MADGEELTARTTPNEGQARDWAVVLSAAGVPCRVDPRAEGWALVVSVRDATRAADALAAYEADAAPPPAPEAFEYGPTRAGYCIAALLIAFRPFTGYRIGASPAFLAGEANAGAIVSGQVWRTVTALTLHADPTHLLGNVVAMALLATAVCRLLGPGLGGMLILVAGAGGNLLNAYLRTGTHTSVGASTAVFGAVGILAGLAIMRSGGAGRRPWVPFAAGLALLGILGTGEHADLAAHFFGFQVGIGLGLAVAVLQSDPPGRRVQQWLGGAALAMVAGAWLLALGTIPRR